MKIEDLQAYDMGGLHNITKYFDTSRVMKIIDLQAYDMGGYTMLQRVN